LQKNQFKKNSLLKISFIILLFIISPCLSQEEEMPLKLKAERLKFSQSEEKIYAFGSVEAEIEGVKINADKMIVDTNKNIATAEGKIKLSKDDYKSYAEYVLFDLDNNIFFVDNFSTRVTLQGVKGDIFLKSEQLKDYGELKTGENGSVTTCDLEHPHYEVIAKSFYFKPNDKLVAFSATFYLNGVPSFWLPVYIYDLAKRKVTLLMPLLGKNDVEGTFIKSEIAYFLNNVAWGSLYLNLMSKKGNGFGIEHNYSFDSRNNGSLYYYSIDEADTKIVSRKIKIDHNLKLTKGDCNLKYEYNNIYLVPSGRIDQTSFQTSVNLADKLEKYSFQINTFNDRISLLNDIDIKASAQFYQLNTSYFYSLRNSNSSSKWQNISQGLFLQDKFFNDKLDTKIRINYFRSLTYEATPYDEWLEPNIELVYKEPSYTAKLTANYFIDTDKDAYSDDFNVEYIEKMPELTFSLNPIKYFDFSFYPELSFAKIHESKYIAQLNSQRHFVADRYKTYLGVGRVFPLGFGSNFSFNYGVEQYLYNTGDQKYNKKESYMINSTNGVWFDNKLQYERGIGEGNTPFYFDSAGYFYNYLRNTAVFYNGVQHRFTIDGGYNYQTNKYFDLLLNYRFKPDEKTSFSFDTGYDIENKQWKDLVSVASVALSNNFLDLFSHTYDLRMGRTKAATNMMQFEIGNTWQEKWAFKLSHLYDLSKDAIILQDAEIIKDLHCWEARFTWSQLRREYKFYFSLKAFPNMPFGFGTGDSGIFFEGNMSGERGVVQ